jgi:hypothetical protein
MIMIMELTIQRIQSMLTKDAHYTQTGDISQGLSTKLSKISTLSKQDGRR